MRCKYGSFTERKCSFKYERQIRCGICRVRPDGSGKTVIYEYEYPHKANEFINVADGWVYFEKLKDSEDLYRVRIDGTGCQRVG